MKSYVQRTSETAAKAVINRKFPWDICIDTSQAALLRLSQGLLATNSGMTDSAVPTGFWFMRGISAHIRVHVPLGLEEQFWALVSPFSMCAPPRVSVGTYSLQPDEDHPGYQDHWKERR
jgi:hypothetical protein